MMDIAQLILIEAVEETARDVKALITDNNLEQHLTQHLTGPFLVRDHW